MDYCRTLVNAALNLWDSLGHEVNQLVYRNKQNDSPQKYLASIEVQNGCTATEEVAQIFTFLALDKNLSATLQDFLKDLIGCTKMSLFPQMYY